MSLPDLPCVPKQDAKILWGNLPYTGLYKTSPFVGTYYNLDTPESNRVTLMGSPLPLKNNGINKTLRLV
jgi:hypothetical protein